MLRRLLKRLRAAWPEVQVELRADSGFAVPRLYAWCEANQVTYTIGLIPNPRLEAIAAPLLAEARAQSTAQGGTKVRLVGAADYQAATWPAERRVIFKAAALAKGPNTRFVVTTRTDAPAVVYDWYVDRGEAENWIKDIQKRSAGRPPSRPPLLGQCLPSPAPCRRLLAARYAPSLARLHRPG